MTGSDLILDTSTIIDYSKKVVQVTATIKRANRVFLPTIVVGELRFGVQRSSAPGKKQLELEAFLPTSVILPIDSTTAQFMAQ